MDGFRTILVPSDVVLQARAYCYALGGGSYWFSTGYSTTGEPPGEWFILTGWVSELFCSLIPLDEIVRDPETHEILEIKRVSEGQPKEVRDMLAAGGMDIDEWAVWDVFNASFIVECEPQVLLSHKGLKLLNEPMGLP